MNYLKAAGMFLLFAVIAIVGGAVTGISYADFMIGMALFQVCLISVKGTTRWGDR